jgi:hypothetical protein
MNKEEKAKIYLKSKGYDLRKLLGFDLNNPDTVVCKGLVKQEAIEAIEYFQQEKIAILGGDVYCIDKNGKIELTYDNWYCDKMQGENYTEYCERSAKTAKDYIDKYKNNLFKTGIYIFNLVLDSLSCPENR